MKKIVLALLLLTTLGSWADTLQFGPGTGTDPVVIASTTSFTVLNNPGNAGSDIDTLLLFFSVPTNLVGGFSVSGSNISLTQLGTFSMTSSGCNDVYECVGSALPSYDFSGLNDSNSFVNYTGAATANGLTAPTSYTIYVYSDGSIAHKQTLSFTGLSLPVGTFVIGSGTQADDSLGFTAFTHAGLVKVPEPASLALLGSGLSALGLFRRKLRR